MRKAQQAIDYECPSICFVLEWKAIEMLILLRNCLFNSCNFPCEHSIQSSETNETNENEREKEKKTQRINCFWSLFLYFSVCGHFHISGRDENEIKYTKQENEKNASSKCDNVLLFYAFFCYCSFSISVQTSSICTSCTVFATQTQSTAFFSLFLSFLAAIKVFFNSSKILSACCIDESRKKKQNALEMILKTI